MYKVHSTRYRSSYACFVTVSCTDWAEPAGHCILYRLGQTGWSLYSVQTGPDQLITVLCTDEQKPAGHCTLYRLGWTSLSLYPVQTYHASLSLYRWAVSGHCIPYKQAVSAGHCTLYRRARPAGHYIRRKGSCQLVTYTVQAGPDQLVIVTLYGSGQASRSL